VIAAALGHAAGERAEGDGGAAGRSPGKSG
jgi:hypothetical protein